jgi:hypothetical protein
MPVHETLPNPPADYEQDPQVTTGLPNFLSSEWKFDAWKPNKDGIKRGADERNSFIRAWLPKRQIFLSARAADYQTARDDLYLTYTNLRSEVKFELIEDN